MKKIVEFNSRFRILKGGRISLVLSALIVGNIVALAAPNGGVVKTGTVMINQVGSVTTINQSSNKASINWNTFSIGKNEVVNFNQPNKNSVTLNRVIGNEKSVIQGMLNANGQVFLLNPNGVLISKEGSINTAGFLASTKSMSDSDFASGNYKLSSNGSSASVVNMGTITIADSGYAALLANSVSNEGTITAIKGKVELVGADEYALNLNGNSLVSLSVTKSVLNALVENKGAIIADGGEIYLTTNAVNSLLNSTINNTGVIQAQTLDELTGHIQLFANGGTTNVSGKLDASAPNGGDGGFIETSGHTVNIVNNTVITTLATNGETGTWLIDPVDFIIAASGGNMTGSALGTSLQSNNITILSTSGTSGTNGDIYVNDNVTWTSDKMLTLNAVGNIYVNAVINAGNSSGSIDLEYGNSGVDATKNIYFGMGENATFSGKINLQNTHDGIAINGDSSYTIIADATHLAAMTTNDATKKYILAGDITSGMAGWTPIGTSGSKFLGKFDGLGHTISGMSVTNVADSGLFGYAGAGSVIQNVGVTGATVSNNTAFGTNGILVGTNQGRISNTFTTGTLTSSGNFSKNGGLVGSNEGTIQYSYSNVVVAGNGAGDYSGGLVGENKNTGTIRYSYATGDVSGGAAGNDTRYNGGFAGVNGGSISDAYATGAISGDRNGGFAGRNDNTIIRAYAAGNVANAHDGGFARQNFGTITDAYWDTTTNANTTYGVYYSMGTETRLSGQSTSVLQAQSTYASNNGWGVTNRGISSYLYPRFIFDGANGYGQWFMPGSGGSGTGSTTGNIPETVIGGTKNTMNNLNYTQNVNSSPTCGNNEPAKHNSLNVETVQSNTSGLPAFNGDMSNLTSAMSDPQIIIIPLLSLNMLQNFTLQKHSKNNEDTSIVDISDRTSKQ